MPLEKTRADTLREYLTGATFFGQPQADPNVSLGNFRSLLTEAQSMSIGVVDALPNITIDYAGGGNIIGEGSLECVSPNSLRWKCFTGTYGEAISIEYLETKLVETRTVPGAFLRVTRTSATPLVPGVATVILAEAVNNVFGFDDVADAEATAGDAEYRATMVVNESLLPVKLYKRWIGTLGPPQVSDGGQLGGAGAGTITTTGSFAMWPERGWCHIREGGGTFREIVYYSSRTDTVLTVPASGRARLGSTAAAGAATDTLDAVPGIAIGKDPAGVTADGLAIQTIANENTAPVGVTWNTGITAATGLDIGTMTADQQIGFWIWRDVPVGVAATTEAIMFIQHSFYV